jgi:hypothetical protein
MKRADALLEMEADVLEMEADAALERGRQLKSASKRKKVAVAGKERVSGAEARGRVLRR